MKRLLLPLAAGALLTSAAAASSCGGPDTAVTMSLESYQGTTLPSQLHWTVWPSESIAQVAKVQFLIDGKLAWTATKAPFRYGGGTFDTRRLSPGKHVFSVRVIDTRGRKASEMVSAKVRRPTLASAWTHSVTTMDVVDAGTNLPSIAELEPALTPTGARLAAHATAA